MIPDVLTFLTSNADILMQVSDSDDDFPAPLGFFLAFASVGFFAAVSIIAWQLASTWRSKMSVAREEAYKELAHKTSVAMDRTATRLDEHSAALNLLQSRVAEIERMLKEVE